MAGGILKKEAVIVLVEGYSDRDALEGILKHIYRNKNHTFAFALGDITSEKDSTESNIEEKIYRLIKKTADNKKWNIRKDIRYIVHIIDLDGAFIPESCIVFNEDCKRIVYTTDTIETNDVLRIKRRNQKKTGIIRKLIGTHDIKTIPYEIYYMSRNLDHALYGKPDLLQDEKTIRAYEFAKSFKGREDAFIGFLDKEVVNGVPDNKTASWSFISNGTESLKRHTNFHLYFTSHQVLP